MGLFKKYDGLVRKMANLESQIDRLNERIEVLEFKVARSKDNRKFYWNGYTLTSSINYLLSLKSIEVKALSSYGDKIITKNVETLIDDNLKENGEYLELWSNKTDKNILFKVYRVQGYEIVEVDLDLYERCQKLENKEKKVEE